MFLYFLLSLYSKCFTELKTLMGRPIIGGYSCALMTFSKKKIFLKRLQLFKKISILYCYNLKNHSVHYICMCVFILFINIAGLGENNNQNNSNNLYMLIKT